MNEEIEAEEVRVLTTVDGEVKPLGVMSIEEAREMAEEEGVDLVLVVPDATPPVVRIVEYSKLKFEKEKKLKAEKQKQQVGKSLFMMRWGQWLAVFVLLLLNNHIKVDNEGVKSPGDGLTRGLAVSPPLLLFGVRSPPLPLTFCVVPIFSPLRLLNKTQRS